MMDQLKQLTASVWRAAREGKLFLLETETAWFILASALDFGMTFIMLHHEGGGEHGGVGFFESNPIAAFFLNHWGVKGLLLFKLTIVGIVVAICQIVARHQIATARMVLIIGTAIVSGVVVYSVLLHQAATGGAAG